MGNRTVTPFGGVKCAGPSKPGCTLLTYHGGPDRDDPYAGQLPDLLGPAGYAQAFNGDPASTPLSDDHPAVSADVAHDSGTNTNISASCRSTARTRPTARPTARRLRQQPRPVLAHRRRNLLATNSSPASGCGLSLTNVCLTDSRLRAEIHTAMTANGWTSGPTHMFFIYTPNGWRAARLVLFVLGVLRVPLQREVGGSVLIYANMPYPLFGRFDVCKNTKDVGARTATSPTRRSRSPRTSRTRRSPTHSGRQAPRPAGLTTRTMSPAAETATSAPTTTARRKAPRASSAIR